MYFWLNTISLFLNCFMFRHNLGQFLTHFFYLASWPLSLMNEGQCFSLTSYEKVKGIEYQCMQTILSVKTSHEHCP